MTKSIVAGVILLAVTVALFLGLVGIYEIDDAALLSLGLVGVITAILFAAFGGFKPFMGEAESEHDHTDLARADAERDVGVNAVASDNSSGSRRLVAVGAEEDPGHSLFDTRVPVVNQPDVGDAKAFDRGAVIHSGEFEQPSPSQFGQALRHHLSDSPGDINDPKSPTAKSDPDTDEVGESEPVGDSGLGDNSKSEQGAVTSKNTAAPWIAARRDADRANADAAPANSPHIEVEESPAWMTSSPDDDASSGALSEAAEDDESLTDEISSEDSTEVSADGNTPEEIDRNDPADEIEPDAQAEDSTDEVSVDSTHEVSDEVLDEVSDELQAEVEDAEAQEAGVDDEDSIAEADVADEDEAAHDDEAAHEDIAADLEEAGDTDSVVAEAEERADGDADSQATEGQNGWAPAAETNGHPGEDNLPVVLRTPSQLELQKYSPGEIMAVVKAQESELVDTLIGEGLLTTTGPITDRDVRTMMFVAVSSNELIDVLTATAEDSQ